MNFSSLATQAAAHDAYFTGLMNQVPTFFATYGRNTINNKYIRHREGLLAASYKGDKKASMNDDGSDVENADSDDEGGDANALFSANNQIATPSADSDDEDVGFGAPKTYADPVELKKRLEKLRQLQPLPKLSRDEIVKRKDARKAKDAIAKAKGIKQKSKQSGGNLSAAPPTPAPEETVTPQHLNKKQKTSSKDDQQNVQLSNMQFSKLLQPHDDRVIQEAAALNHSERNKKTTLSNKQRLQKVENFQQSVTKLRAEGKGDVADQMEHKAAVSNALARAMGDNVNDNVRSLKKFVKQDQKMKEKSQKKWKQIKKGEETKLNEKMDSRNLHIRKKIEHKRDSRIARRKKA